MKNLLRNIRQALTELVNGRPIPETRKIEPPRMPQKVITVDIQTYRAEKQKVPVNVVSKQEQKTSSINELIAVSKKAIENQNGDKIVVLPFEDPSLLNNLMTADRGLLYKYIMKRLTVAIRQSLPKVTIFQFGKSIKAVQIFEASYEIQLNGMMKWFVETEDYESAGVCRDLIRQLKPTNVID